MELNEGFENRESFLSIIKTSLQFRYSHLALASKKFVSLSFKTGRERMGRWALYLFKCINIMDNVSLFGVPIRHDEILLNNIVIVRVKHVDVGIETNCK